MKSLFFLIIVNVFLSNNIYAKKPNTAKKELSQEKVKTILISWTCVKQDSNSISINNLFNLSDAEKIIGQPAHSIDSSWQRKADILIYQSAYKANAEDAKSRKTGAVYFLVEQYNSVQSAQDKYSFIKKANENHEGIKILYDMGDEAYFHSDGKNFYFIMVRKGTKVFNMKLNKITSKTSLDAFNEVAKKIAAAL